MSGKMQVRPFRPWTWVATFIGTMVAFYMISTSSSTPSYRTRAYFHKADGILHDIRNRTLGFEKLLVISLPDRVDKQDVWALAAEATDIEFEYVKGVRGSDMSEKAIPAGWNKKWSNKTLGCLRGHLNAVQTIVSQKLSSALVFEDDAEWDVNIKSQLVEFARGAHYIQGVTNPDHLHSPYGDDWDLLWIGYCGSNTRRRDGLYYVIQDDPTVVPKEQRYRVMTGHKWIGLEDTAKALQGPFARVITEPKLNMCAYAYALSQRGARKYLYNFSMRGPARQADVEMMDFCAHNILGAKCISPFPQLIDNYFPAGDMSKTSDRQVFSGEERAEGGSRNIVFPVKTNIGNWLLGSKEWPSSWPNETMLKSINPETFVHPRGQGMYLTKEQFAE